ncbi:MFS transporter [Musicola paradisiaca]|uniref:Major facilitator superfamily MFS_1 n=1 Tax=Musicola paradisiaca (strain Ech703) TaxID=579405 RepID=C6CDP9_MUSP7|nr:MFS transporter [Musicola paradisiaca]ACS85166.1 major facilitator superfamily MFS_1 [Musicola paradisiaca Ech703]
MKLMFCQRGASAYPRMPILGAALTFLIQSSDTTLLYLALPTLAQTFGVAVRDMDAVVLSYLAAVVVSTPCSDYLMGRWGAGRVYRWALTLFMLAAVGSASATSLGALCLWRGWQGCGGALMLACARVMLLHGADQRERVRRLNQATAIGLLGTLLGPLGGAACLTLLSWRGLFLLPLPLCLPCLWLPAARSQRLTTPVFDLRGYALIAPALLALLVLSTPSGQRLLSPAVALLAAVIIPGLALSYWRRSGGRHDGIFRFSLLRRHSYRVSLLGNVLVRLCLAAAPLMLSLLLQARGASGGQTGALALLAFSLGALGARLFNGVLLARYGYRRLLSGASLSCALLLIAVAAQGASVSLLLTLTMMLGLCSSMLYNGLNTLAFHDLDDHSYGAGNSLLTLVQLMSMTLGISFGFLLLHADGLSASGTLPIGYDRVFRMMGVGLLLCIPLFFQLEKRIGSTASS